MISEQTSMALKAIAAWFIVLLLAILNGGVRDRILSPIIGIKYALPISGIVLCLFIFIVAYFAVSRIGARTAKTYMAIGTFWLALTLTFEFSMLFAQGRSFSETISAYDITTGNLWLLVVVTTAVAPYCAAKTRHLIIK